MASATQLEFEKPIAELERQIDEIKKTAGDSQLSVAEAIEPLERKLSDLREEVYKNLTPLQRVQVARNPRRPFTADYIRLAFTDFIELHGDRAFRDDAAIIGGWARLDGETVMVIGHQRGRDTKEQLKRNFGMPHPEGYRKALRLMKLAEKFHVPVLTFIDTPGRVGGTRRRGARAVRGDRAQSVRDEPAAGADHRDGDRRRRIGRRAGARRRRSRADDGERRLLGDHRRRLRRDSVEGRQEPGDAREGGDRAAHHRAGAARAQGDRRESFPSRRAARTPITRPPRQRSRTSSTASSRSCGRCAPTSWCGGAAQKFLRLGAVDGVTRCRTSSKSPSRATVRNSFSGIIPIRRRSTRR